MSLDFSIIIASRNDVQGLWMSVHSCEIELDRGHQKYDYEYCIVTSDKGGADLDTLMYHIKQSGKLGYYEHFTEPVSAPSARQIAVEHAKGKVLFFFDSHILVTPDYFDTALQTLEDTDADILHTNTRFFVSDRDHWHYKLKLDTSFWAESEVILDDPYKPYRIAAAGHGAFAAQKKSWDEIGGYWKGFTGYAGEEVVLSLSAWMQSKTIWLNPFWTHYHVCVERLYRRHFSDDYHINLMAGANIIGGEKYINKVFDFFENQTVKIKSSKSMFELYQIALDRSAEQAAWLKSVRHRDLDQQLEYFKQNNIPF